MKVFIFLVVFTSLLFSCGGTCVNCHPNLLIDGKYDDDHKILKTCDQCHKDHEGTQNSPCGGDCWDCHAIKDVTASDVIEHKNLQYCLSCHVKLNTGPSNQINIKKLF